MTEDSKTRIMIRVPDNICKVVDTFAGHTHTSRPDVVIDACRKFYTTLCLKEMTIIQAVEERDVPKEVALAAYYEEMESFIGSLRNDYEASSKKGTEAISILVIFPYILFEEVNRIIGRTKQFRNHQDFIKIALMYFFSVEHQLREHEREIDKFLESDDIQDEVEKLRKVIRKMDRPVQ